MPSALVNSIAQDCGISLERVERWWDDAKNIAKKEGRSEKDQDFWSYVVGVVKKRARNECGKKLGWKKSEALSKSTKVLLTSIIAEFLEKEHE